jgi:hypothetical protein
MSTEQLPDPTFQITGKQSVEVGEGGEWEALNPPSGTTDYEWDLGDGTTETTTSPYVKHSYSSNGDVTIRCDALQNGTKLADASYTVSVYGGGGGDPPEPPDDPNMEITGESQPAQDNEHTWEVQNAPAATVRFEWDMGDGNTLSTTTPSLDYTYTTVDEYTITCSAKNRLETVIATATYVVQVVPTGDNSFPRPILNSISSPEPGRVDVDASIENQITQGDGLFIESVDIVLYENPSAGGGVELDRETVGPIPPGETSDVVGMTILGDDIEDAEICVEAENEQTSVGASAKNPIGTASLQRDCGSSSGGGGGGGPTEPEVAIQNLSIVSPKANTLDIVFSLVRSENYETDVTTQWFAEVIGAGRKDGSETLSPGTAVDLEVQFTGIDGPDAEVGVGTPFDVKSRNVDVKTGNGGGGGGGGGGDQPQGEFPSDILYAGGAALAIYALTR